jgi:hypothetical protein
VKTLLIALTIGVLLISAADAQPQPPEPPKQPEERAQVCYWANRYYSHGATFCMGPKRNPGRAVPWSHARMRRL